MDSFYLLTVALVLLGGVGCAVIAATGFRGASRAANAVIALVCFGYVVYVFTGGSWVFPLAALLPFGAIVKAFKGPQPRVA